MNERGNFLIAAAIILAIIAVGIFLVMSAMGHNPLETAKECIQVTYYSGIVETICK